MLDKKIIQAGFSRPRMSIRTGQSSVVPTATPSTSGSQLCTIIGHFGRRICSLLSFLRVVQSRRLQMIEIIGFCWATSSTWQMAVVRDINRESTTGIALHRLRVFFKYIPHKSARAWNCRHILSHYLFKACEHFSSELFVTWNLLQSQYIFLILLQETLGFKSTISNLYPPQCLRPVLVSRTKSPLHSSWPIISASRPSQHAVGFLFISTSSISLHGPLRPRHSSTLIPSHNLQEALLLVNRCLGIPPYN
jgi:hypothetical protein